MVDEFVFKNVATATQAFILPTQRPSTLPPSPRRGGPISLTPVAQIPLAHSQLLRHLLHLPVPLQQQRHSVALERLVKDTSRPPLFLSHFPFVRSLPPLCPLLRTNLIPDTPRLRAVSGTRLWRPNERCCGCGPIMNRLLSAILLLFCEACVSRVFALALSLGILRPETNGVVRITGAGGPERVHVLETSTNLSVWSEMAVVHDGPFEFPDLTGRNGGAYFRARSRNRTGQDDWRNLISLPDDELANAERNPFDPTDQVRWVKFAILLAEPHRVFFQDSEKYPFHVDFARARLTPFAGMSPAQFDAVTLRNAGRQALLGAILIPPESAGAEFGIQFVSNDPLPPEETARWFETVRRMIASQPGTQAFYIPTFEQTETTRENEVFFRERGIAVESSARWVSSDQSYSEGWAYGRLVFLPASQIAAAYGDGRLRPEDILLTDSVPAEIPFISGVLTLSPATPNSHVAILARSYQVPFGYSTSPAARSNMVVWSGREVALRVTRLGVEVALIDPASALSPELREELLALKRPPPLAIRPKERLGLYSTNTLNLVPADSRFVGGKASNYGLLRRLLPTNSPPAIALSFDLWDDFMAQSVGGRALREEIAQRLGGFSYPADMSRLRPALSGVQDLIRRTAQFSPALRTAVIEALQNSGLPLDRKIRFRSSTNVEDTEQFSGAGLYDSYSGCLTDDLDSNNSGPSACDPDEPEERGVFRAIQRVYASFYNENAFLERRRFGVDESAVGMAVLVAESFPDPDELGNGVATLKWSAAFGTGSGDLEIVSQPGAESVTNPDSASRPELVDGFISGGRAYLDFRQGSGLLPLGAHVFAWDAEYQAFAAMFIKLAQGYRTLTGKTSFTLDFEYKKSASRGLQVKQVREIPRPPALPARAPFLLDQPLELLVEQGEFGDPMAIHRLKSRWGLRSRSVRIGDAALASSIHTNVSVLVAASSGVIGLSNGLSGWTGYAYGTNTDGFEEAFVLEQGTRLTLKTSVPRLIPAANPPFLFPADLDRWLVADYARPRAAIGWDEWGTVTNEVARLVRQIPLTPGSQLQTRRMTNQTKTLSIETRFYWPERRRGIDAGYTAPNIGFVETRITGLTIEPMVLTSYWSQTYSPEHHNFAEHFIFEPHLDERVTAGQKAELEHAGIRMLHVRLGGPVPVFTGVAPDESIREIP